MWVARALKRSDEYMKGRTCRCCKAVNFKTTIREANVLDCGLLTRGGLGEANLVRYHY